MPVTFRCYRMLTDFDRVHQYLADVYDPKMLNGYLLPQLFEYSHTHAMFNQSLTHRFGIWESDGDLVGFACYDMYPGECFISVRPGYESLLPDIVRYAEYRRSRSRALFVRPPSPLGSPETGKQALLASLGYAKQQSTPVTIFPYDKPFPDVPLPEGFTIVSLAEENDPKRASECLWYGFDHGPGPDPDDNADARLMAQGAPNFRPDLTTVIKAPGGEYACFAGMWLDDQNHYAYLEPLATLPQYRRMGLATIAVVEGMKKSKRLGATYCFGGAGPFYDDLGFETVANRELWQREWRADPAVGGAG